MPARRVWEQSHTRFLCCLLVYCGTRSRVKIEQQPTQAAALDFV
jgi:hypothetical protein